MRLLLIRHGQTPSNLKHLLDTAEPGPALTPLGQEQAAALPEALAGEEIDALYVSTLLRTQLTAAPLATRTGLEVRVRDGIRELSAGDTELRMPGGENGVEALRRFDAVVAEAAGTGAQTVAMVSHGAAIRVWVAARAENVDVAFASAHELQNTGVVILSGDPVEGWRAQTWAGRAVGPERSTPGASSGPAGEAVDDVVF
jgi:broad specificity phosphatase PhoE